MRSHDHLSSSRSPRIVLFWDLDVFIGEYKRRRMTARPLQELERVLGHRLHVESWWRSERLREGVWKFEAFSYLDTIDPALAAYSTLMQLKPLSRRFGMSWQGYNAKATTLTEEPDDKTICAFYWNPPDQLLLPRLQSSGVMLRFDDRPYDRIDRYHRSARPVVAVPANLGVRADFTVEFTIHIECPDEIELRERQWPRIQNAMFPEGVSDFSVDTRTFAGKPAIIRVTTTLHDMPEHQAVAFCLSRAPRCRIEIDATPECLLRGDRHPHKRQFDGVVAFEMMRARR